MNRKEKAQLLTQDGVFHIFAIDHRDVLTVKMEEKIGAMPEERVVLEEKFRLIDAVQDLTSAVLVDTHYFIQDKKLDPRLDMDHVLIGIERNNYDISKVGEGYLTTDISIRELAERGCKMVKLFVFYQPDMAFTDEIDRVIEYVTRECDACELPLMLEPVLYQSTPENRLALTKEMLTRLKKFNIDIYKIDFPGDLVRYTPEENLAICREIDALLQTPWIILSSGVTLEDFRTQLAIAGQSGACGYAVGRSVWNPYILRHDLEGMRQAFAQVRQTAEKHCHRWHT